MIDSTAGNTPEPNPASFQPLGWRDRFAIVLGNTAARVSRLTGRGSGGMIGGRVASKISPKLLSHLSAGRRIALVTGTNGKTTTTRMLSEALRTSGSEIASNRGGDNMTPGILAALMSSPRAPYAVLEVDEMHLQIVAHETKPEVIVLLNLTRDQLDRVGEMAVIERRIRKAVAENPQSSVVVNVDDPLMTSAAWEAARPVWVAAGKGWCADSITSPRTGDAIIYDGGVTGENCASGNDTEVHWKAVPIESLLSGTKSPGTASGEETHSADARVFERPQPRWVWHSEGYQPGAAMQLREVGGAQATEVIINLPGRANRGNASQALVAAQLMGVDLNAAAVGVASVRDVAGRYAHFDVSQHQARMILVKNPAGWMESLTMLNPEASLVIGVNGQHADGTDLSWLWDVNFESLAGRKVVATGERGADLQVRLNYAGIETIWAPSVWDAIHATPPGQVDLLLNYTCLRDTRAELIEKGMLS